MYINWSNESLISDFNAKAGQENIFKPTMSIQKVKKVYAYSPRTCFIAADHWFLVFSMMLKSCLMQLYVGPCHVVSAEIAVAMSVPI